MTLGSAVNWWTLPAVPYVMIGSPRLRKASCADLCKVPLAANSLAERLGPGLPSTCC